MKLSKISSAVLVSSLMAASVAQAAVEVSGGVAFTNNYMFRGISQSNNGAAVQGELGFTHESGVYFTAWASSINGPITTLKNESSGVEIDTLLGYASSVGDVEYDVGVMRYNYPKSDNGVTTSYNEIYGSLGYKGATVGLAYSDDYFAETGKFAYVYAGYEAELAENLTGSVHVGYNKFDKELFLGDEKSYVDYSVGVSYAYSGLDFGLSYVGTSSDTDTVYDGLTDKVVFSVAKSF